MQMRVESRVHTDDSGGWTFFRKHADEDEIGVVDPVKGVVWASINTLFSQRGNAFLSALEVGDKLIVLVLAGVDVGNGGLCGLGVHGDVDAVYAASVPVGAHHDDAFEAVRKGFVATGFPVVGGVGLLAQHHGGAMGEEVDWWDRHGYAGRVYVAAKMSSEVRTVVAAILDIT